MEKKMKKRNRKMKMEKKMKKRNRKMKKKKKKVGIRNKKLR